MSRIGRRRHRWSGLVLAGGVTARRAAKSSPRFLRPLLNKDKLHVDRDSCLKSWHQKACLSNESQTTRFHCVQSAVCCFNWTVPADSSDSKSRILSDAGCGFSTRSLLHSLSVSVSTGASSAPLAACHSSRRTPPPGISDIGLPPSLASII